eukprot:CAMPEP_0202911558 /NCGR_PEP_ID=MMETSP1392-20130828/55310_1 /ASSEMBLY_ACC=CAM_ASM_000868 /TAXON_ID=225041 /ORGANISM="Chlamydomonas chlamydogama, Strain SAG 11-48b" /LENGTH=121 /DNA_ID=CAMNT_0049602107 /DNA_START=1 /DNA_END=362 /DNA_ORIENTATION=+
MNVQSCTIQIIPNGMKYANSHGLPSSDSQLPSSSRGVPASCDSTAIGRCIYATVKKTRIKASAIGLGQGTQHTPSGNHTPGTPPLGWVLDTDLPSQPPSQDCMEASSAEVLGHNPGSGASA